MENRLPPGFDPEVWKGWEPCDCYKHTGRPEPCGWIERDCADYSESNSDPSLKVAFFDDGDCGDGIHYKVVDEEGFGTPHCFATESEAAAFANTYAESHGGFV